MAEGQDDEQRAGRDGAGAPRGRRRELREESRCSRLVVGGEGGGRVVHPM